MTREEIFARLYTGDTVYPPPLESKSALLEVTLGCSYRKCRFCDFPKDAFVIHSLQEIAEKCGYEDYKHFSVEFKKHMGVTPGAYLAGEHWEI